MLKELFIVLTIVLHFSLVKAQQPECLNYDSIAINGVSFYEVTERLGCKVCFEGILKSGKLSINDLQKAKELKVFLQSPDNIEELKIISFRLIIERNGGLSTSFLNSGGNILSDEIKKALSTVKIGNKIIINNIFIQAFPTYVVGRLSPIMITISNVSSPIPCQQINNRTFRVFFKSGSIKLSIEAIEELNNVVEILKKEPDKKAKVTGFTDTVGDVEKNIDLSNQRAKAAADFIISKGVSKERINFSGSGDQASTEAIKTNRRVEIELFND
ncbi:MAG: OmpA family protein [Bacteroidota bacterium]|nr:OmpA family protein [Bacteroidota bacterium]